MRRVFQDAACLAATTNRTRIPRAASLREGVPARSIVDDFRPGELANLHHLLVDLLLRSAFAEDASKVIDLGGNELVVLRQQTERGALQVAFGHGDGLGSFRDLFAHRDRNDGFRESNPANSFPFSDRSVTCGPGGHPERKGPPAPPLAAPSCNGTTRNG